VLCAPHSDFAESYRHFAIRLERALKARGARSVVVTSAVRAEGKTTTACNLSLALASMARGRRIALLELDVRRPAAARALGVTVRTGIERVIDGAARIAEACAHTQLPELDLYLVNRPVHDALSAIVSPATGALIRDLARQYDVLVIDAPPVLPVPDVSLIAAHADAVLVVARRGVSRRAGMVETIASLGAERIVGAFLNEQRIPLHRRYGASYGYPEPGDSPGENE
jgi:receptor protein-tyrosine kinase